MSDVTSKHVFEREGMKIKIVEKVSKGGLPNTYTFKLWHRFNENKLLVVEIIGYGTTKGNARDSAYENIPAQYQNMVKKLFA